MPASTLVTKTIVITVPQATALRGIQRSQLCALCDDLIIRNTDFDFTVKGFVVTTRATATTAPSIRITVSGDIDDIEECFSIVCSSTTREDWGRGFLSSIDTPVIVTEHA